MIVGKIENGLEPGFVKHGLNCLLITDPLGFLTVLENIKAIENETFLGLCV